MKFYSLVAIIAFFLQNAAAQNGCSNEDPIKDGCVNLGQNGEPGGMPWFDNSGPTGPDAGPPDCAWYGAYWDRCTRDGGQHANFGMTACKACCECGGGVIVEESPSESPSNDKFDWLELYNFNLADDSEGGDLIEVDGQSMETLAELCALVDECIGFNSMGFLKERLLSSTDWTDIESCNDVLLEECGLYVKKTPKD
mmetsp:Transcript_9770/g.14336  ORF Transcript_9770/g.14336 Transcript_9770/m.14336 type:complete len:197 (-) Transcript_9770:145-735(-)|eukprot:CAMPEP_0194210620 /NCGR_PEP_ID=MMETSP0156-20130528/8849_1 /TAXON_ID=33649 /ORGANISM="Thalassionema nitzschioides, Strain L26-B" /LENGTH=196 /DNA_ID=CAMNT_0038937987 /DNA_START=47 /DNA_END=637 /DNA_ORIENTATION=+